MRKLILWGVIWSGLSMTVLAQEAKMTKAIRTAKWLTQTRIEFMYSQPDSASFAPERRTGNNWLFEYVYRAPENPEMTDDEFTEIIAFEVPPVKGNQFSINQKDLAKTHAYYMLGCFCRDRGFKIIKQGTITGKKINKQTWQVVFDFKIDTGNGVITKKYKGQFKLAQN